MKTVEEANFKLLQFDIFKQNNRGISNEKEYNQFFCM